MYFIVVEYIAEMSSCKQRLNVDPCSKTSNPRKRRFDHSSQSNNNKKKCTIDSNRNKSHDCDSMSQINTTRITTNKTLNRFPKQNYSYHFKLFGKRRQLPVWEYKDAFMATLEKNQVHCTSW
jgi:hypothetical protein